MTPKKKSAKKNKRKSPKLRLKTASRKRTIPRKKARATSKKSGAKRTGRGRASGRRAAGSRSTRVVELLSPTSPDDLGLSNTASADSESVDELLDEGNAFEASVVSGVEEADDSEGKPVRTKEVPEDDVPEEYLDNES